MVANAGAPMHKHELKYCTDSKTNRLQKIQTSPFLPRPLLRIARPVGVDQPRLRRVFSTSEGVARTSFDASSQSHATNCICHCWTILICQLTLRIHHPSQLHGKSFIYDE